MRTRLALAALAAAAVGGHGVYAQPARRPLPSARELMGELAGRVMAVEPYRSNGYALDFQRGYWVYLQPESVSGRDCRSVRITFWLPQLRIGEPDPDKLPIQGVTSEVRYRRAGVREIGCGDPRQGRWTVAQNDHAFSYISDAFERVRRQLETGTKLPFTLTCVEVGRLCADPRAAALKALSGGFERFVWVGDELIATAGSGNFEQPTTLKVTTSEHGFTRVDLKIDAATIS